MRLRLIRWLMIFRGDENLAQQSISLWNMLTTNVFQWCILLKLAVDNQSNCFLRSRTHVNCHLGKSPSNTWNLGEKSGGEQTTKQYHLHVDLAAQNKIIYLYCCSIWIMGIMDKPFFSGENEVISFPFILPFILKLTSNKNCVTIMELTY